MTDDRELLELAAKAAGIELVWSSNEDQSPRDRAMWDTWNPLQDDGDALRLAVKRNVFGSPPFWHFLALERFGRQEDDDCTAYRRAIVRAAAALASTQER